MLVVRHRPGHEAARRWILDFVFAELWATDHRYEVDSSLSDLEIRLPNGRRIVVRESFFAFAPGLWRDPSTLPGLPLEQADFSGDPLADALTSPRLPVLYGSPVGGGGWLERNEGGAELGIDVFGLAFTMMSRYEETVLADRDRYLRFPALASVAYKEDFLDRPLVDECLELLRRLLVECGWPVASRGSAEYRVSLGHDVDAPFKYLFCGARLFAKTELAARLRRGEGGNLVDNWRTWRKVRGGELSADPYNTFDFIMRESEARGWHSTFYFIADRPAGWTDCLYEIDDQPILDLIREVVQRGHRVALHGSFHSYVSTARLQRERARLASACLLADVPIVIDEIRQHYLRFDAATTPGSWSQAGFKLDTTLSFAQHAGFRCGTSRTFRMFDVDQRLPLDVFEQPLIAMDTSLIDYQRLTPDDVVRMVGVLASRVARYGGCMTLLWHNSMLSTDERREHYLAVLDAARGAGSPTGGATSIPGRPAHG